MKILGVNKSITGNIKLHPIDIVYKKALQKGLADTFNINCKIEDMESIAGPFELMGIIKKLKPENYAPGENFRANFHLHTNASDGSMTVDEFLNNCLDWVKKLRSNNKNSDGLPLFSAAITDHDRVINAKKAIAEIVKNPKEFKDFKFAAGCEFMFNGEFSGKEMGFEAVGLGFNPFDRKLDRLMKGFSSDNKFSDIPDIKASGGVLSWAHPLISPSRVNEAFMTFLKKIGIGGVEANYQYLGFKKEYINEVKASTGIEALVKKLGMFRTGGTDSHRHNIFSH